MGEFGVRFVSGIFDAKVGLSVSHFLVVLGNSDKKTRRVWCVGEFGVRNRPLQNDQLGEFSVWASLVCNNCNVCLTVYLTRIPPLLY